ncbi:MAG: mandelate racemase [Alphaproteobacteria bacterium]|nr:mandelate racemase [Alphaproteobacteria bacterium]
MTRPVQTAAGPVSSAPMVLVDIRTEEGVTGSAYVFTYNLIALGPTARLIANLEPLLKGHPLAPVALGQMLAARFRLLGPQGLVGIALAAVDMALWDAHARVLGTSLARLLGAFGDERLPAYASLRGWTADELAEEAGLAVADGFAAVKLKIGHPRLEDEVSVIRAVRDAAGDTTRIMVDYNQALSVPEAVRRAAVLDELGLDWIEEPVRADDYVGHAEVARASRTPIQVGENYWGPHEMARSLQAGASDLVMPEAMKIGGVTGWMQAASLAAAAGRPISSHIFVEFSSQLLAATPGRDRIEWLDLAAPILAAGTPKLDHGFVTPDPGPGAGLVWDETAVTRFALT